MQREHFEFDVQFWALSRDLLAAGLLRAHPVAVRGGGLGAIAKG
jgi:hypothetical protein